MKRTRYLLCLGLAAALLVLVPYGWPSGTQADLPGNAPSPARSVAEVVVADVAIPPAAREAITARRQLRVVDEQGDVVDDVVLEAWSAAGALAVVRSEAGRWEAPSIACIVSARSPRFLPYVAPCPAGGEALEIVLCQLRRVAVLLVAPDGPAAGVLVRFRNAAADRPVAFDSDLARQWCDAAPAQRARLFASLGAAAPGPRWSRDQIEARTDEQGWVRCDVSAPTLLLEVDSRKRAVCDQIVFTQQLVRSVSAPFPLGPQGASLVVHLQPGAVVRGGIEPGPAVPTGLVRLLHELSGGPGIRVLDDEMASGLHDDGTFQFFDVMPGAKTVVVTTWPRPDELEFAVAAFAVDPGQDVDLGVLRPENGTLDVELAVVDATTNAVVDVPDARWDLIVGTNPLRGPVLAEGVRGLGPSARLRVRGLPPGLVRVDAKLAQGASLPAGLTLLDTRSLRSEQTVQVAGSVRLEARVCSVATSSIELTGATSGPRPQGELVDIESGERFPIDVPLNAGRTSRAFVALPQLPRRYRFGVRSESGETGVHAAGEVSIVGGEPFRLALVPASALRAKVRGAGGPSKRVRLRLSGLVDDRVVRVEADGAAVARGLTPGAAYELRALDDEDLSVRAFEGAADGVHRFTAGEAGSTVDLGVLVVRD
jgi:hypothetical protein